MEIFAPYSICHRWKKQEYSHLLLEDVSLVRNTLAHEHPENGSMRFGLLNIAAASISSALSFCHLSFIRESLCLTYFSHLSSHKWNFERVPFIGFIKSLQPLHHCHRASYFPSSKTKTSLLISDLFFQSWFFCLHIQHYESDIKSLYTSAYLSNIALPWNGDIWEAHCFFNNKIQSGRH